jgi:hypothetical protein
MIEIPGDFYSDSDVLALENTQWSHKATFTVLCDIYAEGGTLLYKRILYAQKLVGERFSCLE